MAGLIWLWQVSGGTDHAVTAQDASFALASDAVAIAQDQSYRPRPTLDGRLARPVPDQLGDAFGGLEVNLTDEDFTALDRLI